MKVNSILLAISLLVNVSLSVAQIPTTLTYQGVLADTLGNPKPDGAYSFTFRLFESASGGTSIWSETKSLSVRSGLFFTALGDQTPLGTVQFDRPYWLSLQVGGDPELSPRVPLTSAGYSMNALRADTARYALSAPQQTFVDSARIAGTIPDNTVTSAKIQDGTVASADLPTTQ
jgi:hypothetical protein